MIRILIRSQMTTTVDQSEKVKTSEMMKGSVLDKRLAEKIASFEWAKEVSFWDIDYIKGSPSHDFSIDVDCGYIETTDDYQLITCEILDDIREILKLEKVFDGHYLKLITKDDNDNRITFTIKTNDKKVFGEILGCELVANKNTYTSYSCKVRK